MDLGLDGRVALVTGAGGAIGAAIARLFAEEGAAVVVADIDVVAAQVVVDGITAAGGKALAQPLDVSSEASWQAAVQRVGTELGTIDILVNNAGLNSEADAVTETLEGFQRSSR